MPLLFSSLKKTRTREEKNMDVKFLWMLLLQHNVHRIAPTRPAGISTLTELRREFLIPPPLSLFFVAFLGKRRRVRRRQCIARLFPPLLSLSLSPTVLGARDGGGNREKERKSRGVWDARPEDAT